MSTLIAYVSQHGAAEKAARQLEGKLQDEVTVVNLKKNARPDPAGFDTVIIGGSIHAGKIQKAVKKFCQKNLDILTQKRLGLYLCCMEEGETAQKQFDEAYPAELRKHAAACGLFGGEFNFDRMNFLEKKIIQKVAGVSESVCKIKEEQIDQFARIINGS
jgi:menaquinone-dependent protoporphyrinogen oxidase